MLRRLVTGIYTIYTNPPHAHRGTAAPAQQTADHHHGMQLISLPASGSRGNAPLELRISNLIRRFLKPDLKAELQAELQEEHPTTAAAAADGPLNVTITIKQPLPQALLQGSHSSCEFNPVYGVIKLVGGDLGSLTQDYHVSCPACGYVSPAHSHLDQLQHLLSTSPHPHPSTGLPCTHLSNSPVDFLQLFCSPAVSTGSPGVSHPNAAAAAAGATGRQCCFESAGLGPDPQAVRLMSSIVANIAIHIIAATSGHSARGKQKDPSNQAKQLLPWRPWAIRVLTEDVDVIHAANWTRPSFADLFASTMLPAPAAAVAATAANVSTGPAAAAATAAAPSPSPFNPIHLCPQSLLDMLLAPPWVAVAEPHALEDASLERVAVLLKHWYDWLRENRPDEAAASTAALSKLGYLLDQRKAALQHLLLGLLARDAVFSTVSAPARLGLFLQCAGISGSIDQALTKLDKTLKTKPYITSHVETCAYCGLSTSKLKFCRGGNNRKQPASVMCCCAHCLVAVCIPCVLAAAGKRDPTTELRAGSIGSAEAAEAAACWPRGLCPWCSGADAVLQARAAAAAAAAAVPSPAAASAAVQDGGAALAPALQSAAARALPHCSTPVPTAGDSAISGQQQPQQQALHDPQAPQPLPSSSTAALQQQQQQQQQQHRENLLPPINVSQLQQQQAAVQHDETGCLPSSLQPGTTSPAALPSYQGQAPHQQHTLQPACITHAAAAASATATGVAGQQHTAQLKVPASAPAGDLQHTQHDSAQHGCHQSANCLQQRVEAVGTGHHPPVHLDFWCSEDLDAATGTADVSQPQQQQQPQQQVPAGTWLLHPATGLSPAHMGLASAQVVPARQPGSAAARPRSSHRGNAASGKAAGVLQDVEEQGDTARDVMTAGGSCRGLTDALQTALHAAASRLAALPPDACTPVPGASVQADAAATTAAAAAAAATGAGPEHLQGSAIGAAAAGGIEHSNEEQQPQTSRKFTTLLESLIASGGSFATAVAGTLALGVAAGAAQYAESQGLQLPLPAAGTGGVEEPHGNAAGGQRSMHNQSSSNSSSRNSGGVSQVAHRRPPRYRGPPKQSSSSAAAAAAAAALQAGRALSFAPRPSTAAAATAPGTAAGAATVPDSAGVDAPGRAAAGAATEHQQADTGALQYLTADEQLALMTMMDMRHVVQGDGRVSGGLHHQHQHHQHHQQDRDQGLAPGWWQQQQLMMMARLQQQAAQGCWPAASHVWPWEQRNEQQQQEEQQAESAARGDCATSAPSRSSPVAAWGDGTTVQDEAEACAAGAGVPFVCVDPMVTDAQHAWMVHAGPGQEPTAAAAAAAAAAANHHAALPQQPLNDTGLPGMPTQQAAMASGK